MTHIEQVARNPRLLFWGRAIMEMRILSSVIVLFYLHRGLHLDEIYFMSIVWSLTSLATEVPSGYLADRIGRKHTLLLGVMLLAISQVISFFAIGFWPFVLSFVFMSASFSCFSGTEEALLFESLRECGMEHEMNMRSGKQLASRSFFSILVPSLGAFIARDLLEWQFQILLLISLGASACTFVILSRLTEPKQRTQVSTYEIGIFKQSLEVIRNEPWLLKVALNKFLVFVGGFIAWRVAQPFLVQHGFGIEFIGVFYMLFQSLCFGASWFSGHVEQRVGTARLIVVSALLIVLGLVVALTSTHPWIVFIALAIALSANDLREPVFAHAVHQRLHSRSRATTLSNLNMIKGVLDIPLLLLAGTLAERSLVYPFVLAIALCLSALIFFPIRSRDLQT